VGIKAERERAKKKRTFQKKPWGKNACREIPKEKKALPMRTQENNRPINGGNAYESTSQPDKKILKKKSVEGG